ncbi:hypothetical protein V5799_009089 [Amblyomma americanum]|uniref:CCHC-type domain-containing protein n=1 Tax=Amblyomma americanum TaxID=6943 RepID=A0AAQ4FC37_AMBAM
MSSEVYRILVRVALKSKAAVDRFLAEPVVRAKESEIRFEYRGVRAKAVRVFCFELDEREALLTNALDPFGRIMGKTMECVPGFPDVPSGVVRIRMEMSRPVPNLLKVADKTVQCEYEGVVRVCRKCEVEGHLSATCTAPQCSRCMKFGHDSCDAPCPRCGGDHRVDCTARTYSSVAAVSQAATVPSDAASVVTGPPSESTAAAQEAVENSCAGEVSAPAAAPAATADNGEEGPVAADVTGAEPRDQPASEDAPVSLSAASEPLSAAPGGVCPTEDGPAAEREDSFLPVRGQKRRRRKRGRGDLADDASSGQEDLAEAASTMSPCSDRPLAKRQGVTISAGRFAALAEGSGMDSDSEDETPGSISKEHFMQP